MDEAGGHYKWNKADGERKYCLVSFICRILKINNNKNLIETESRAEKWLPGAVGWGKSEEISKRA